MIKDNLFFVLFLLLPWRNTGNFLVWLAALVHTDLFSGWTAACHGILMFPSPYHLFCYKAVSINVMKAYWGSTDIAQLILKLGTGWRWVLLCYIYFFIFTFTLSIFSFYMLLLCFGFYILILLYFPFMFLYNSRFHTPLSLTSVLYFTLLLLVHQPTLSPSPTLTFLPSQPPFTVYCHDFYTF